MEKKGAQRLQMLELMRGPDDITVNKPQGPLVLIPQDNMEMSAELSEGVDAAILSQFAPSSKKAYN